MKLIIGNGCTPVGETFGGGAIDGWFRDGIFPGERPPQQLPVNQRQLPGMPVQFGSLFNVSADPEERHPLDLGSNEHHVRRMRNILVGYATSGAYREPQSNMPTTIKFLPRFHDGTWAPFLDEPRDETSGSGEFIP